MAHWHQCQYQYLHAGSTPKTQRLKARENVVSRRVFGFTLSKNAKSRCSILCLVQMLLLMGMFPFLYAKMLHERCHVLRVEMLEMVLRRNPRRVLGLKMP